MCKQWNRRMELGYRVRVRQQQNVEDHVDEMYQALESVTQAAGLDIDTGGMETHYWPIDPEKIEEAKQNGFLVVEFEQKHCLIIREIPFTIPLGESTCNMLPENLWNKILEKCGDVFTSVQIIDQLFTDNEPV